MLKYLKKINNWVKLSILVSFLWTFIGSFLYFLELNYHGRCFIPVNDASIFEKKPDKPYTLYSTRYEILHDYLSWTTKEYGTWEILDKNSSKTGRMYAVCILKPTFNIFGFIKLLLFPIFLIWLLIFGINIFFWRHRRDIVTKTVHQFQRIDPLHKVACIITIVICYLVLYSFDIPSNIILIILGLLFVFIPIILFLIKKAIVNLVFSIAKAIEDAKKTAK